MQPHTLQTLFNLYFFLKAPIQATDTAKIESVERLDGDCIFKLQFKGNDEWTLKARCEV